jgi:hypothetical protein
MGEIEKIIEKIHVVLSETHELFHRLLVSFYKVGENSNAD